jgi:tetratricopeptide (TPR) repeat protein
MGLREWGLAAILLGSASCTQPKIETAEARIIDHYKRGMKIEQLAEAEQNDNRRKELFTSALREYELGEMDKPADCKLKQAYCHSQLGNVVKAIDLTDSVIAKEPSNLAFYVRGLIKQKQGWHAMAIKDFDKSIELQDQPEARWARYSSYMSFSSTTEQIIVDGLLKALDDINKYIETKKEEPDGYLAKYSTISLLAYTEQDNEKVKDAYETLKTAFKLVDSGKPIAREDFKNNLQVFRLILKTLAQEYETAKEHY